MKVVEFTPNERPAEPPTAAPPVAPAKPAEEEVPLSKRAAWFAETAKREQARAKRELALKGREQAAAAREQALQEREAKLAGAKGAPLEALKAAGLTYDDVTNAQLNDGRPSAELIAQQARDEIAALRAELAKRDEDQRSEATTQAQQAREAARRDFVEEATAFVQTAGEAYELLNLYKPYDLVVKTIEAERQKSGKVLMYAEAAQRVEDALRGEVEKAAESKWFKARKPAAPQPAALPAKPRATISNDLTAATPPVPARPRATDPIRAAIDRYEESRRSQSQH